MSGKAQGALEYLLLIGGAILVAAIVVAIITSMPSPGLIGGVKCAYNSAYGACTSAGCMPVQQSGAYALNADDFFRCAGSGLAMDYGVAFGSYTVFSEKGGFDFFNDCGGTCQNKKVVFTSGNAGFIGQPYNINFVSSSYNPPRPCAKILVNLPITPGDVIPPWAFYIKD